MSRGCLLFWNAIKRSTVKLDTIASSPVLPFPRIHKATFTPTEEVNSRILEPSMPGKCKINAKHILDCIQVKKCRNSAEK